MTNVRLVYLLIFSCTMHLQAMDERENIIASTQNMPLSMNNEITLRDRDGKIVCIDRTAAYLSPTIASNMYAHTSDDIQKITCNTLDIRELRTIKNVLETMLNNAPSIYDTNHAEASKLLAHDLQSCDPAAIERWGKVLKPLLFPSSDIRGQECLQAASLLKLPLLSMTIPLIGRSLLYTLAHRISTLPHGIWETHIWQTHLAPALKEDLSWQSLRHLIMRTAAHTIMNSTPYFFNLSLTNPILPLQFSADDQWFTATSRCYDNTVVWNATNWKKIKILPSKLIRFSPNKQLVAAAFSDYTVKIFDTQTWQELKILHGHRITITAAAFSPDGTCLATGSIDGMVILWDTATWSIQATLKSHPQHMLSIIFSPNGTTCATQSTDNTVNIWDRLTYVNIITLPASIQQRATYSPDNKWLATSSIDRDSIVVWDTNTWKGKTKLHAAVSSTRSMTFSTNGRWFATLSTRKKNVKIWDTTTWKNIKRIPVKPGYDVPMAFSPHSKWFLTIDTNKALNLWDTATWQLLASFGHISCFAPENATSKYALFSHDAQQVVVTVSPGGEELILENNLTLWNLSTLAITTEYLDETIFTYEQFMLLKNIAAAYQYNTQYPLNEHTQALFNSLGCQNHELHTILYTALHAFVLFKQPSLCSIS